MARIITIIKYILIVLVGIAVLVYEIADEIEIPEREAEKWA